ncbi:MAG: MBL fold metallo-hydrolase [Dehalococcoidia bacterium]|nr:MBL fold metallo-hydrolase [Dehalococcoidia bacterium]MCB9485765.1 MBL fold metallo-hydrolase [Thermoflexaceae bacterium]
MSSQHVPHGAGIPAPSIEEVSPGIFAYIQLDGSWFLNNAGCIVGSRTATLIDTTGTEARGNAWRTAVSSITSNPVTTLLNTHHHADHTNGNFAFAPGATIIGHELCRHEIVTAGQFPRFSPRFPGTDFGDCPPTPPTVTFADKLTTYVDDLRIELSYVGPAHTTNDVVAWIPDRKLLFAGDVLFNGGTPFMMFGSLAGSLEALDRIEALKPEVIVPGHGAVCGPEVIARVRAYLEFVRDTAKRGFDAGVEPAELARDLDLGQFGELTDPERIVPNLHRAYLELRGGKRGAHLPMMQMFDEMVAYNGGQPLRCLA